MLEKLTINDVKTGETAAYPWLQPVEYDLPPGEVFAAAERVARAMRGWRNVEANEEALELHAEAVTRVFRFVDDFWLWVDEGGQHGRARVRVRSRSRKGRGDFGANAKRIDRFLRALDRELAAR